MDNLSNHSKARILAALTQSMKSIKDGIQELDLDLKFAIELLLHCHDMSESKPHTINELREFTGLPLTVCKEIIDNNDDERLFRALFSLTNSSPDLNLGKNKKRFSVKDHYDSVVVWDDDKNEMFVEIENCFKGGWEQAREKAHKIVKEMNR